jgi:hypothetical protein
MQKPRPGNGDDVVLLVRGVYAATRQAMPGEPRTARYDVVIDGTPHHLEGIQWADWGAAGRLLVATTDGRL